MAVTRMVAVTLIGPNEEMEEVARQMVLMGGFQPLPLDLLLSDRSLRSKVRTATENPYDELLVKLSSVWKVAEEPLPEPFPVPLSHEFILATAKAEVNKAANKLELWQKRRAALIEEAEQLEATRIYLEALTAMGRTPSDLVSTRSMKVFFGKMSNENFKRLDETIEESPMYVLPLKTTGPDTWVLVFSAAEFAEEAKKILETAYFKTYSLEEMAKKLEGENPLERINRQIENRRRAIDGLAKAAKDYIREHRAELETLYSRVYTMQRVYELCKGHGELSGMYVISGWIPEDMLESVKKTLEKDAPHSTILVEEPSELPYSSVKVPTFLRNLKFVRPFQDIVALYSLPSYGEIDPSFIVALSFCLFFGFMFGDVGHGALLFLAAIWLQKKRIMRRSLATVLKFASTCSMIFGFLYGSVFGVEGVLPALWLSPMKDMGKILGIAVGIGIGFISLGLILNMVMQYRHKNFGRLLFDGQGLAGLVFYWSAAGLIFAILMGYRLPFPMWLAWTFLGALLVIIILRDVLARVVLRQKTEGESAILYGFEVFHNLLSFLSNTASFVRLAAFALNHIGLSLAVMMLADMVRVLPGGILWKIVTLILGNATIVALEGLIVFIQTLRLEYYEFFSKFYRGGGRAFRPVRWERAGEIQAKESSV